jgi:integrase
MNLCRKPTGVYYYQRRVPNDLIEAYDGKKKFMFSLQTKDRQDAIKRARLEGLKHDQEFEAIRRRKDQLERISDSDLEIIAINEANSYFEEISEEYRSQFVDDREKVVESINTNMDIYSQALLGDKQELKIVSDQFEDMMKRHYLPEELPSNKRRRLLYEWLTNMVEIHRRLLDEFSRPWEPSRAVPLSMETVSTPSLGQAVEEYLKDSSDDSLKKRSPIYMNRFNAAMRVFLGAFGKDKKLKDIRFNNLKDLRNILVRFPANVSKKKATRDLEIEQVIQGVREDRFDTLPSLSPNTVNGYLGIVKGFFDFCVRNDWIDKSPYDETLRVPEDVKAEDKRLPFKPEHLKTIFKSHQGDAFKKWGVRLAVSLGLRLNEVCELQRENFEVVDGLLCIRVGSVEGQRTKTASSRRTLPIPQKLIDAGFIQWLESRPKGANIWGFVRNGTKYLSSKVSQDFSRWCKKLGVRGIDGSDARTFHSFRHAYRDAFRDQEIPKEVAELLGGWSVEKDSVADNYGSGLSIEKRKHYLDRLEFPKEFMEI